MGLRPEMKGMVGDNDEVEVDDAHHDDDDDGDGDDDAHHELNAAAHLPGPDVPGHELLHRPILLLLVLEVHSRDPVLVPVCQTDPGNRFLSITEQCVVFVTNMYCSSNLIYPLLQKS